MERRKFLSGTAGQLIGLSAIAAMMNSNTAFAGSSNESIIDIPDVTITDDENDYKTWSASPSTPNGEIRYKILWSHSDSSGQSTCELFRFQSGVIVPKHMHPEGELTLVLAGTFAQQIISQGNSTSTETRHYSKGDTIWMPAQSIHGLAKVDGPTGVTILSFTPKSVVFGI